MQEVCGLVHEIRTTIRGLSGRHEPAVQVLSLLDEMDLSATSQNDWVPNEPPHDCEVRAAIEDMPAPLSVLADALKTALPQLQWRVDQGTYYESTADVGDGYRTGNMHCELIGPNNSAFDHDDFTLGLFVLTPRVLYRDHAHKAPELYLTLSEPAGWRFGVEDWRDVPAGTMIWNAPDVSHATRVYDKPFLAVYSWTCDIRAKCRVVPRDDWYEIESALQTRLSPSPEGKDRS